MTYLPALVLHYASGAMRLAWPPPLDWKWSDSPKGWTP
jgi:hypothetical protein